MSERLRPAALLLLLAVLLEAAFLALRHLTPWSENLPAVIALGLAGSVVYLVAVFLVFSWREARGTALVVVLLAAVAFRATLFSLSPALSDDLYRYRWEGRIQQAGHNPYLVTPADPALAPLGLAELRPEELARVPGRDVSAAYGPLTELLFWLAAGLDGSVAFKFFSVFFDLATLLVVVVLLRARGEPPVRALAYAWCPLVVLEFSGSGHNDSLAVFCLLLALLLVEKRQSVVSSAALAAATMGKWFALVLAPVFWRRSGWRGVVLFALTAFLFLVPYLGAGWGLLNGLFVYASLWRNNASLYSLMVAATGVDAIATGAALGLVAGLALHLAWQRAEPLRAAFLLLTAVLLLSPSVFPWYVTWLAPFLCFFPNPAFLLFTATVLLSYHVLIDYAALGVWHYTSWLLWLEYLPVYALLLWASLRQRRQPVPLKQEGGG